MELHNVLKSMRKKHKYSQAYIAEYLHITQQAYGHWETGKRKPPIEDLIKIAELYNVSIDFLCGRYKNQE